LDGKAGFFFINRICFLFVLKFLDFGKFLLKTRNQRKQVLARIVLLKFYTFSKVLIFSLASVVRVLVAVVGATASRFLRRRFGMVLACI
jgi:hypothetical protein